MRISWFLRETGMMMREAVHEYFYPIVWLYKKARDKWSYLKYRLGF